MDMRFFGNLYTQFLSHVGYIASRSGTLFSGVVLPMKNVAQDRPARVSLFWDDAL